MTQIRFTIFMACLMAASMVMASAEQPTLGDNYFYDGTQGDVRTLFTQWMHTHKMSFPAPEFAQRFKTFSENLEKIRKLNEEHHPRTSFAVNKFAHLSTAEFKETYLLKNPMIRDANMPVLPEVPVKDLPESFDWAAKDKNVVTPVKNQGSCGSCWAFSATGNIEGQWALAKNELVPLSEQHLVDCDHECIEYHGQITCDAGCRGGLMPNAFNYVIKNRGIAKSEDYPYLGYDSTCRNTTSVGATLSSWSMLPQDENQMQSYLVNHGPIAIAANAMPWQFYFGGVYYLPCGTTLDHGIIITGYGVETNIFFQTMPYWIIKNSWGSNWGKDGYIWLQRGVGKCGVDLYACTGKV